MDKIYMVQTVAQLMKLNKMLEQYSTYPVQVVAMGSIGSNALVAVRIDDNYPDKLPDNLDNYNPVEEE